MRKQTILVAAVLVMLAAVPVVAQTTAPAPAGGPELVPGGTPVSSGGGTAMASAPATSNPADKKPAPGNESFLNSPYFLVVMLGGVVLLWWWTGRANRKKEADRKQLLGNLKKGDKITTIGGIHGSVVELRDDGTVMVKIDENVRVPFERWAIRDVNTGEKDEKSK